MRGKRVKQLRESVRQEAIITDAPARSLKRIKRNHHGERRVFIKTARATGYFCSRPAAQHRKAMIAAKHERMVESDI